MLFAKGCEFFCREGERLIHLLVTQQFHHALLLKVEEEQRVRIEDLSGQRLRGRRGAARPVHRRVGAQRSELLGWWVDSFHTGSDERFGVVHEMSLTRPFAAVQVALATGLANTLAYHVPRGSAH